MRKFTKEIAALIASAAIGTAAGVVAFSASPEEIVLTEGVAMNPDETVCYTELPTTAGVPLPPDAWIESTTEEELPPIDGDIAPPDPTIEEIPPLAGEPLPPDAWIESTDPTEEEMPPLVGDPMPTDEWIESTTEEELPPLMGDIAPADGDINGDGSFNADDVALLQKWLLNVTGANIGDWTAADFNRDGKLDVFDLMLMKRDLIKNAQIDSMSLENSQLLSEIQAISADDISKVTLTVFPPSTTVQLTRNQIDEMLTLLKNVIVYEEDNSYDEYDGQWIEFDITLNDGRELNLAEYNPFFIINGVGYRAEYAPNEALGEFANSIISE